MTDYERFESPWPVNQDPALEAWRRQLAHLPSSGVLIRDATATPQDGRRIWDLQMMCSPITPRSVRDNVSLITERTVLIAEIGDVHVGFCASFVGSNDSDPIFVLLVGVVAEAQRRGVGLALLTAAAGRDPVRDIAIATLDENIAERALNDRFARSIGATPQRVPRGIYPDRHLGIRRGDGYRVWITQRPPPSRVE